ncbi:hypothetical protein ST47_g94 [Ascochyta rabiei]|uniref:Uncharacterized protein n=1 Tax=Didymella rabiei TaxID=5454 RepID=A0A163MJ80_DIDRA|nr:hypothetical protein ST47_g94 [Ascochyta rabiei]
MITPVIKREVSPEQPLAAIPSRRTRGAITSMHALLAPTRNGDCDTKSSVPLKPSPRSKPPVQVKTKMLSTELYRFAADLAALPAPATYRKGFSCNYKARGAGVADSPRAITPSVLSSLSSQAISAPPLPKQTVASIQTHPNHLVLAGHNSTRLTRILSHGFPLRTYSRHNAHTAAMEGFPFDQCNATGDVAEGDMSMFNTNMLFPGIPDMVTLTRNEYQTQQVYTQILQDSNFATQQKVDKQHVVISELADFNRHMHSTMHKLDARVAQLEHDNAYFRSIAASHAVPSLPVQAPSGTVNDGLPENNNRSPFSRLSQKQKLDNSSAKRPVADAFAAEGVTMPGRTKYRKKLQVNIPGKENGVPLGLGLPTPMPSALQPASSSAVAAAFLNTPRTPYTPGRIGPPDSYKRTTTSINKRDIHNLNRFIPPANVLLPMVPLTDTEVIVYFFNSLSKPMVSLRLYARGWGPASIVQALNDHREVEPPYLRNTCSVKCTTAIKSGKRQYGNEWEEEQRAVYAEADDCKATDLIRPDDDESVDYYIRALCANLKQHPDGENAGIFTACVKYCAEHNAPYTTSNVWQLAVDLQDGNVPQHPSSPNLSDVAPEPQNHEHIKEDDTDDEWSENGAPLSPSPLAKRKSNTTQSSGSIGFTAVNALRDLNSDADE